jgi:hypothetical protein
MVKWSVNVQVFRIELIRFVVYGSYYNEKLDKNIIIIQL